MQIFGKSDIGLVREENQDSFVIFKCEDTDFLLVCDGMGGHLGGKRASFLACEIIEERINERHRKGISQDELEALMRSVVNEANAAIWQCSVEEPENRGMGTTVVMTAIRDRVCTVLNLGDSRAYMIGKNTVRQITKDHSYVQSLVDKGEITAQEARIHPERNIKMQAVGLGAPVQCDVVVCELEEAILLCSDGLNGELEDEVIFEKMSSGSDAEDMANRLIDAAIEAGGSDNITVVIGRCLNGQ